jgi:hypothetical protein
MPFLHDGYLLVKNKTSGADPLVDSILSENGPNRALYEKARAIFLNKTKKLYVEACLLASDDLSSVSEVIDIPISVLDVYRRLFFNVAGADKLTRLSIVEESENDEKSMKMWALSQGLEFIGWRLGKITNISPVEGLKDLFTLCTYKSKEAMFSPNSSDSSVQATKWAKLSMDLARLLKAWVMDAGAAKRDIELALKTIDPTFTGFDDLED